MVSQEPVLKSMRRAFTGRAAVAAMALALVGLAACVMPGASRPVTVKIIALNDYHGQLESPGAFAASGDAPVSARQPVGGAEFIAAHVARLKSTNPNNVVVAAGDLIGATPMISGLFFDEPAVETLNRIGLEFTSVGNHEFDKGQAELLRLQTGGCKPAPGAADGKGIDPNSCRGAVVGTPVPFEGAKFQWLSANVITRSSGKPLLPAYGVKRFAGVPVAFIGMTLRGTQMIVGQAGVAGLEFRDEIQTVNALVPQLRAQGIEAIVVLIHEGGMQSGPNPDINRCQGGLAGSPIAGIVAGFDDAVDLVISGHTHSAYVCTLPNVRGRAVPVTSANAFGRMLTDIDLSLDPTTRDVLSVQAANRLVIRDPAVIQPDPIVAGIVAGYRRLVSDQAARVVGTIATDLPTIARDAACNVAAGELVADAQLAAARADVHAHAHVPGGSDGHGHSTPVIAFMNRGGLRGAGLMVSQPGKKDDGTVTYGEIFAMQPFGNNLVTMSLSAQDIKDLLEQQFAGCRGQSPTTTRVLIPSAGFHYRWDGAAACDARISAATLFIDGRTVSLVDVQGRVLQPDSRYRVTVNNYLADGGDGFSTFLRGRDRSGGPLDVDALADYLAAYRSPNRPYGYVEAGAGTQRQRPDPPRISRAGGSACPTGALVNP
jgi:5'-nucleotidase